jgi:hypothetical protein
MVTPLLKKVCRRTIVALGPPGPDTKKQTEQWIWKSFQGWVALEKKRRLMLRYSKKGTDNAIHGLINYMETKANVVI